MDTIIRETLRPFGITRNYRGYPQTVRAIALVLEDESRLLNVTEEIYEVVALQTRCHPSNVERNIGLSFSARGIQTDRFWSKWRDLR